MLVKLTKECIKFQVTMATTTKTITSNTAIFNSNSTISIHTSHPHIPQHLEVQHHLVDNRVRYFCNRSFGNVTRSNL